MTDKLKPEQRRDDFPPETYLAAARIAYPDCRVELESCPFGGSPFAVIKKQTVRGWEHRGAFYPHNKGGQYRALREALDKRYFVRIRWSHAENKWESKCCALAPEYVFGFLEEDITTLMLRNVEALVEAGVVE